MTREDFISWLDRPLTDTDNNMIDTLLEVIENYDTNINIIYELTNKLDKIEKIINENKKEILDKLEKQYDDDIEVLDER